MKQFKKIFIVLTFTITTMFLTVTSVFAYQEAPKDLTVNKLELLTYHNGQLAQTDKLANGNLQIAYYHYSPEVDPGDDYWNDTPESIIRNNNKKIEPDNYDYEDITNLEFIFKITESTTGTVEWDQDGVRRTDTITLQPANYMLTVVSVRDANNDNHLSINPVLSYADNGSDFSYQKFEADITGDHASQSTIFTINLSQEEYNLGISGEQTVINNIDAPYSLERIKQIAEIQAFDDYYGDLTDQIEIVRDTYSDNMNKVGNFEIEFKVTNPSNLSTTYVLNVSNKDLTKPVITGPGMSTISYTEEFNLANLLARFTVTDNHDTNVKVQLESTTHKPNKLGTYQFKLFAKDNSNNVGTFVHTLTIVDDVKPVLTDNTEGVIQVNWKEQVSDATLKLGLIAHDAIDGDITDKIKVTSNDLKTELGSYTVKYEVTDNAGNKSTIQRTYQVITTDAPIFLVSKNLLILSDVNLMTNEQLAAELARYEGIQMASFAFISNEYETANGQEGIYQISLAIADTKGVEHIVTRTVEVFAEGDLPEAPEAKVNIFQKVIDFIVKLVKAIWNVLVWIWNLLVKIWNFVFGWIK